MTRLQQLLLLACLALGDVIAAPRDVSRLEDIARVTTNHQTHDTDKPSEPITLEEVTSTENVKQGDRQKRFYNYYGFGYPPMNPVIYPNYPNPNEPFPNNFPEDPLLQIYRRLQDISSAVRNQNFNYNQPPPPPPFPILFPVIFIPAIGCNCRPQQPPPTPTPAPNGTDFDISNRFPEMDDDRQNWGLVVNQTEREADDGLPEDFTRPISFVPIRPNRTSTRPPPEVEHGSNQAGVDMGGTTTTTTQVPSTAAPAFAPPLPAAFAPPLAAPTPCDAAILTCCHQPQVTYDCFVAQACPDPTSYGNPCEAQVILGVIDRYQRFYGQRTG